MTSSEISNELKLIASQELERLKNLVPESAEMRFSFFYELLRTIDLSIIQYTSATDSQQANSAYFVDILQMGFNLATSLLYIPSDQSSFKITTSTKESREMATSFLYSLGVTSLLKRVADMVYHGHVEVEVREDIYILEKLDKSNSQFLDLLEVDYLASLNEEILSKTDGVFKGWDLFERENLTTVLQKTGNFFSINRDEEFSKYLSDDIESSMSRLIKPFDHQLGTIISYGATPEIDNHFLAIAAKLVGQWRNEAGLPPSAKLGTITATELMMVTIYVVSLHLKHLKFLNIAVNKFSEISLANSVTIWSDLKETVDTISQLIPLHRSTIETAINLLTFRETESHFLKNITSRFSPLLISVNNSRLLRPISSIHRNPFFTVIQMLEYRDANIRHSISAPRESWMRENLYAMFAGNKYQIFDGNFKIRDNGKVVTDIDAIVYDNLSGDIALFQIKWQDYFYNDVQILKSKAKNLTFELDSWAEKVSLWVEKHGVNTLYRKLGFRQIKDRPPKTIFLFGISVNHARMQGYGFPQKFEKLAISTWPQFVRNRSEIGPTDRALKKIHEALKIQQKHVAVAVPIPVTINIGEKKFIFNDLWCAWQK